MTNKFPWGKAAAIVGIVAGLLMISKETRLLGGGFTTGGKGGSVLGGVVPSWDAPVVDIPSAPQPVLTTKKESVATTPSELGYVRPQPSQALLDAIYQRDIEPRLPKSEAQKIIEGKIPYTSASGIGYTGLFPDLPRLSSGKPLPIVSGGTKSKKDAYKIDISRTGEVFEQDVLNLKASGASYIGMSPTGEFLFSKPKVETTKKEATETTTVKNGISTVTSSTGKVIASSRNTGSVNKATGKKQVFTSRGWIG